MEIFTLCCPNFYKRQKKAPDMGSEGRGAVSQVGLDQKPTVLKVVGAQLICQRKDTNLERVTACQYNSLCPT